jgi:hypothetical protein
MKTHMSRCLRRSFEGQRFLNGLKIVESRKKTFGLLRGIYLKLTCKTCKDLRLMMLSAGRTDGNGLIGKGRN